MKYFTIIIALCVLAAGCSSNTIPVVPVSGTVNYNGKPVEGALVAFEPETNSAHGASGTTDADGNFTLQTVHASKPGAEVGTYFAVVLKETSELPKAAENLPTEANLPPDAPKQRYVGLPKFTNHLPKKYGDKTTTPFKFEVKKGKNTFTLDLTD